MTTPLIPPGASGSLDDILHEMHRAIDDRPTTTHAGGGLHNHRVENPRGPQHPSNKITLENLDDVFGYKKPNDQTVPRFAAIENAAKEYAKCILRNAPDCAFRSKALSELVTVRMLANAAIATSPTELLPSRRGDHTTECGTKYRGCSPECAFEKVSP